MAGDLGLSESQEQVVKAREEAKIPPIRGKRFKKVLAESLDVISKYALHKEYGKGDQLLADLQVFYQRVPEATNLDSLYRIANTYAKYEDTTSKYKEQSLSDAKEQQKMPAVIQVKLVAFRRMVGGEVKNLIETEVSAWSCSCNPFWLCDSERCTLRGTIGSVATVAIAVVVLAVTAIPYHMARVADINKAEENGNTEFEEFQDEALQSASIAFFATSIPIYAAVVEILHKSPLLIESFFAKKDKAFARGVHVSCSS